MQSMQPAQQYPYNSNGHHHASEAYRATPQQQHHSTSHAPLLPPIQHFEGQQNSMQYAPMPMNGAQMSPHPPHYPTNQFQYANGAMQPMAMPSNVGANGQNGMMRFPIPPQGPMPITPGRSKAKEVKRRTKTGCLTCRKRRIKCDEAHPHCRNCQKSKRECLGYDPIFKQQNGPAVIQPAPASSTTPTSKSTSTAPTSTTTSTVSTNAYQQPQAYPGPGSTFVPTSNPVQSVEVPLEYGAPLDPALAGGDSPPNMAANSYSTTLQPARQVKHVTIEQLFSLNDVPPRYDAREAPPPDSIPPQNEVDDFYRFHYAIGLDKMFETNWYSTRGLAALKEDSSLLDYVWQCMERMKSRTDDLASIQACQSLEARLVWLLATMPRSTYFAYNTSSNAVDGRTMEVLLRIDVIEHLLTGQFLSRHKVPHPEQHEPEYHGNRAMYELHRFWHQLGRFTAAIDDGTDSSNGPREINDALAMMRGDLGMIESRDVLYSLAIARHFGGRLRESNPPQRVVPQTHDMEDDVNKLRVAQQFVEQEEQKGTTQVIQRICGMAVRSWMLQKQ